MIVSILTNSILVLNSWEYKEVLNMFSEALRILDNNTAELMADRYKAELEVANKKAERWKLTAYTFSPMSSL